MMENMNLVLILLARRISLSGEILVTKTTVLADFKCNTATMNGKPGTQLTANVYVVSSRVQTITISTSINANVPAKSTKNAKTKLSMANFIKWCGTKEAVSAYANPKK